MLIIIILEVPVELAELLGENAPGLPEGLAGKEILMQYIPET